MQSRQRQELRRLKRLIRFLQHGSKSGERAGIQKGHAPGEARTHNLGIALHVLLYKYRALTDCATGAPLTPPRDGSIMVYSGPVRASAEHAHPRLAARGVLLSFVFNELFVSE